eukprot:scaffold305_cov110-Cylindrotheca_fusiformis.AAC.3
MVANSKAEYESVASSDHQLPVITIGDKDIKVIVDNTDDQNTRPSERNSYSLEKDPSLAGHRSPVNLPFCPHCAKENIRTSTKTYPNGVTWAWVAVGAVFCFPLCWVPLVVDKMKKTDHYCQNCGQKLASIGPLEGVGVKERF